MLLCISECDAKNLEKNLVHVKQYHDLFGGNALLKPPITVYGKGSLKGRLISREETLGQRASYLSRNSLRNSFPTLDLGSSFKI